MCAPQLALRSHLLHRRGNSTSEDERLQRFFFSAKEEVKPVPKAIRPLKAINAAQQQPAAVSVTETQAVAAPAQPEGVQQEQQAEVPPAPTSTAEPIVVVEAVQPVVNEVPPKVEEEAKAPEPLAGVAEGNLVDLAPVAEPKLELTADLAGLSLADELQQHQQTRDTVGAVTVEEPMPSVLSHAADVPDAPEAVPISVEQIVSVESLAPTQVHGQAEVGHVI